MESHENEPRLSIDKLKDKFGEVRLEIISQERNTRTSCVRRLSDNTVVACSKVQFHDEGIAEFDKFHQTILAGAKIGETIQNSGIAHERIESDFSTVEIDPEFISSFGTDKTTCLSRTVEYKIQNLPYTTITEFYNPELSPL